jgi:hypothetical protein
MESARVLPLRAEDTPVTAPARVEDFRDSFRPPCGHQQQTLPLRAEDTPVTDLRGLRISLTVSDPRAETSNEHFLRNR